MLFCKICHCVPNLSRPVFGYILAHLPPPRKCPRFGIFPLSAVQLLGTHLSPRVHFHGYSLFFSRKGALTHHPEGAVVLPAATVRSARRMRLLREPYVQCHITSVLLPLATQSAICFASSSKLLFPFWKQPAACPHKAATGSFICGYGYRLPQYPFSFCEKETKTRAKGR